MKKIAALMLALVIAIAAIGCSAQERHLCKAGAAFPHFRGKYFLFPLDNGHEEEYHHI